MDASVNLPSSANRELTSSDIIPEMHAGLSNQV